MLINRLGECRCRSTPVFVQIIVCLTPIKIIYQGNNLPPIRKYLHLFEFYVQMSFSFQTKIIRYHYYAGNERIYITERHYTGVFYKCSSSIRFLAFFFSFFFPFKILRSIFGIGENGFIN